MAVAANAPALERSPLQLVEPVGNFAPEQDLSAVTSAVAWTVLATPQEALEPTTMLGAVLVTETPEEAPAIASSLRFIGSIALKGSALAEREPRTNEAQTLLENIHRARHFGEYSAQRMVRKNIVKTGMEIVYKHTNISTVTLEVDDDCNISQNGQRMESVYENTLTHGSKDPRIGDVNKAETNNNFRKKEQLKVGNLEHNWFLAFSLTHDSMTPEELAAEDYFVPTMTMSIQASKMIDGELVLQTAFVAGVTEAGGERHDIQAVIDVMAELGIDYSNMSTTEMLDSPALVPEEVMPHGVASIVERLDDKIIANVHPGKAVYFGVLQPRQDYATFAETCNQREAQFDEKFDTAHQELLHEAPTITKPVQATERLHKIVEKHMVHQAITDRSIDPIVFGLTAAPSVVHARAMHEQGRHAEAQAATNIAVRTAKSSSCPGSRNEQAERQLRADTGNESSHSSETKDAACEYVSKECPKCKQKNVWTIDTAAYTRGLCLSRCIVLKFPPLFDLAA